MKRTKWKGPFLSPKINLKPKIPLLSRDREVTANLVNIICNVHSGLKLVSIHITDEMIGHKLGEFVPTRAKFVFKKSKKK